MAYKITDKCISCGACAGECPVGCISQGDERFVIDQSACISCGLGARSSIPTKIKINTWSLFSSFNFISKKYIISRNISLKYTQ